jgi:hypothetical protein
MKKRKKRKVRGPGRKVASDTLNLILGIRNFQQQEGVFPEGSARRTNYIDKLILPGLLEHALSNRFDELYRASKKYPVLSERDPRSQALREIGIANHKFWKANGRAPNMKEWRAQYLAMRPGYRICMRTFRWMAKQTRLPWTRLRKVK